MQKELLFRQEKEDVSDNILTKLSSFKDALKLCKEVSGLTDLQICQELDIDPGHFSRIWSDNAHFPDNKFIDFITLCKNLIPIRWSALKFGMQIKPLKSTLEVELEEERTKREEAEKKLAYFEELIQKVRTK